MDEFNKLLAIADRLLGSDGCPWDREQTLFSLQPYLLEETHELIEAIDSLEGPKIAEELGDVLYALVFVAKLGEKEGSFRMEGAIQNVCDKLIRRHPHVFGEVKAETSDEIVRNWEEIKKGEFKERKSALDGVPSTIPTLARAQKMIQKMRRARKGKKESNLGSEGELGEKLWELLEMAEAKGFSSEDALRRVTAQKEREFRKEESQS